jgi:hypothetical protein
MYFSAKRQLISFVHCTILHMCIKLLIIDNMNQIVVFNVA